MVEHSQMQFFGETYSVQDLLNLLGQINTVIEGIRDYRQQQINEKYSEILNKYIELVVDEGGESTPITRV
jgi:uncharacterized protein YutD